MNQRSSSQDKSRRASVQDGKEPDYYDRVHEKLNSPRGRQAVAALSNITVEDLRKSFRPGKTETGQPD